MRIQRHVQIIATATLQSTFLFFMMAFAAANADPYLPSANGNIVIEAEHFDLNVDRGERVWVTDFTPGYTGDAAMRASPNSWKSVKSNISSNSPRMDYDVNVPTRTTVNVWVRGLSPSSSADSIWIGIDGDDSDVIRIDPTLGNWGWETTSQQLTIPAGTHVISVWMREDGTIVDRLFLSPSPAAPVGDGGAESSRGDDNLDNSGSTENTWPVANDDAFSIVNDGTSHLLPVLADNGAGVDFDPDDDKISISAVGEPSNSDSSVTIDATLDGLFFTPGAGTDRTETFNYTIDDGNGGTGTATASVSVTSVSSDGNGSESNIFAANDSGQVVIEAEHYDRKVSRNGRDWVADFTPGFVGDSAMRASPDSWRSVKSNLSADSPRMDYSVSFDVRTLANVWVRGLGSSGSADSVWVSLDGDESNAIQINPTRGTWGWETSELKMLVPAGMHTVNIWMRDDGTIVDRLLLTPSSTRPNGAGPGESNRSDGSSTSSPSANNPPRISGAPSAGIPVGSLYSFTPTASDADGESLTFSIVGLPAWMNFNSSTGRIRGTPGNADTGTHSNIIISVSDGIDSATLSPFSIRVGGTSAGSATLNWTPPTNNEDGSPLNDLAGYRIYWGTTIGTYPNSVTISNPGITSHVVGNLAPGNYHFVSTSFNSSGIESSYSNRTTKNIP